MYNTVEDTFRNKIVEESTRKNMISHPSNQNLSYTFKTSSKCGYEFLTTRMKRRGKKL
jgi:hypothetical protein